MCRCGRIAIAYTAEYPSWYRMKVVGVLFQGSGHESQIFTSLMLYTAVYCRGASAVCRCCVSCVLFAVHCCIPVWRVVLSGCGFQLASLLDRFGEKYVAVLPVASVASHHPAAPHHAMGQ